MQRVEREPEPLPDLLDRRVGKLVPVEASLVEQLLGELVLDVPVERLGLRRVVREERVCLDVEREMGRRAFDPELRVPLRRREVVGGVDFHQRELRGVELQSTLRRLRAGRVEVPVLDERGIRPRRGPDQDRATGHGPVPPSSGFSPSFFLKTASFAWFAFSLAILRSRCAQTYSVARIARPAMITRSPGPGRTSNSSEERR